MNTWLELVATHRKDQFERMSSPTKMIDSNRNFEKDYNIIADHLGKGIRKCMPAYTFSSIQEALTFITQGRERDFPIATDYESSTEVPGPIRDADHIQVLCTGSLYLVGGTLQLLDPDLNSRI